MKPKSDICLSIMKCTLETITKVSDNITRLITCQLNEERFDFSQLCRKPEKNIIPYNRQFVNNSPPKLHGTDSHYKLY